MDLIMRTLSLPTPNPVEIVMQVLRLNGIDNALKEDIYNMKYIFSRANHPKKCIPSSLAFKKRIILYDSL
ncbi:hypothetical protein RMCBS344292_05115 [Rhizopus microsporus]|nr:hypothetical protein RMCBS344292_05115 [Rhizopus microsporus]